MAYLVLLREVFSCMTPHPLTSRLLPARRNAARAAFTVVEVLIGSALVAMTIGAGAAGLLKMQEMAMESRLLTCAQTVAQNQIDRVLYQPYIPQNGAVATVLKPGGTVVASGASAMHYWDSAEETKTTGNVPANWYSTTSKTVPIFDPVASVAGEKGEIFGTVAITVVNPGLTQGGEPLNLLRVSVNVTYPWRGRDRTVTLSTQRASDL